MEPNKEVIIIGGGVIGLATAHYLMENGIRVRLIEKDKVGDGASHGNCGLLYFTDLIPLCAPGAVSHEITRTLLGTSPLYIKPGLNFNLYYWLMKFAMKCTPGHRTQSAKDKLEILNYSENLFQDLLTDKNLTCDLEKKGYLTVFKNQKNFDGYHRTNEFLNKFGLGYKPLNKEELHSLEPALSNGVAGAWFNETDWHLRPDRLMATWHSLLVKKGLIIEENCEVLDFNIQNNSIKSINTSRGEFAADVFVLATGAWSPKLASQLNFNLPVQPGKGYSITLERPEICPERPCVLYEKNMVVTPWESGLRLGGTMEFSGYGTQLNPNRLKKLVDGAKGYIKPSNGHALGHRVVEEWTSLRPMTYDDMPIIDRSPNQDNLFVGTGHGMLGLTLASGTGKILSDMVCGSTPEVDVKPYAISRF